MNLKGRLAFGDDQNGNVAGLYTPTPDEMALLKTLLDNPAWAIYRKILLQVKEGYFHSTLGMIETNKIVKNIGIVTGINYAVNQLDAMLIMEERRLKKEQEQAKKPVE